MMKTEYQGVPPYCDMWHSLMDWDRAKIYSENREDGIGYVEWPYTNDDYMDFLMELIDYFEFEIEIGQQWEYAEELLLPFFPSMKEK